MTIEHACVMLWAARDSCMQGTQLSGAVRTLRHAGHLRGATTLILTTCTGAYQHIDIDTDGVLSIGGCPALGVRHVDSLDD